MYHTCAATMTHVAFTGAEQASISHGQLIYPGPVTPNRHVVVSNKGVCTVLIWLRAAAAASGVSDLNKT